jgi:hypothetical protein
MTASHRQEAGGHGRRRRGHAVKFQMLCAERIVSSREVCSATNTGRQAEQRDAHRTEPLMDILKRRD